MNADLNVTLLKAMLQVHELVMLTEDELLRAKNGSHTANPMTTELKFRKDLIWKQKQVPACIDT